MKDDIKFLFKRIAISFVVILMSYPSCRKDNFINSGDARLSFSADTVYFDTVFTSIGSSTRNFKVYNPHNRSIKISSIRLGRGESSNFRINIDGTPSIRVNDIEIRKKDSLYIFVEVTVNPNSKNNPLVIRDSVVFETNGNIQDVNLEAWGQDAYYHRPDHFPLNGFPPYSIISCNSTWTNDKPHVIFGLAAIDSGCCLNILPGTKIHLHNKAIVLVLKDACLKIKGSLTEPVNIQGDRLESEYADIPGQWGYIWLSAGSINNEVDWANIKNGSIGFLTDSFGNSPKPTLRISNSKVTNMTVASLYGRGSKITGVNCVFANCGQASVALTIGGFYSFKHCTFANYWPFKNRTSPALVLNNWYEAENKSKQIRNLDSAYFGNCIITGALEGEIGFDSLSPGKFNFKFENSLLKVDSKVNLGSSGFQQVTVNTSPDFKDISKGDYRLNQGSTALDKGSILIGSWYPLDLKNNSRINDKAPDPGAYEFSP